MKKIIGMFIVAFLTISVCSEGTSAYAEATDQWVWYADSEAVASIEQYIAEKDFDDEICETEAQKAYHDLMNSFSAAEDDSCYYPDNFGGTYFDDKGNLVILYTTSSANEYEKLYREYPTIEFKQVKYSINELNEIVYDIMSNPEYTFYYAHIDEEKNDAIIFTDEKTYNDEKLTSSVEELPVRFEIGSPVVPNATVYGGTGISVGGVKFTSGAVATNSTTSSKILVTAGHYTKLNDKCYPLLDSKPDTSNLWGTVTKSYCQDGKYGDYSLITLESSMTITTNTYEKPYTLTPLVGGYYPKEGDTLYKYGVAGKVAKITFKKANVTMSIPNDRDNLSKKVTVHGMMTGKIEDGVSIDGDSGGPVYYNSSEGLKLAGFVSGTYIDIDGNTNLIFTPVTYVHGCSVYYTDD